MSKFAVLADIHANESALYEVLSFLDHRGITDVVCLGDIIGYNASPRECLAMIRERNIPSLQGNHERYVFGQAPETVQAVKRQVVDWTRETLTEDEMDYIRNLPTELKYRDDFLLVHGSPTDPDEYILSNVAIKNNLRYLQTEKPEVGICFYGHTHYPMVIGPGKLERKFPETKTVYLDRYKTYIINPGSVGQPRDECPMASFGIFDPDAWSITIHRIPYDIKQTQTKSVAAGIDKRISERLSRGK